MVLSNIMLFWNFLVASCLVHAEVIRDDGYRNYEGQFTVKHKGRMLRVLMFFKNVQLEICTLHCVRHLRCRTINYHHGKKDCELTEEDFDEINVDTITPGWYNYGTPAKVDGGWSSWKNFTVCTKKCGNGTMDQWRDCDSPKPEHGGVDCKGRRIRKVKCNTHGCTVINLAFGKTTKQSSTNDNDEKNFPSKAVDGSIYSSSETNYESKPWWELNLGEVRQIESIYLNAYEFGSLYNLGLLVETRKSNGPWILCKNIGDVKERVTEFRCDNHITNMQFLRIRSTKKCFLSIYDLRLFGYQNN